MPGRLPSNGSKHELDESIAMPGEETPARAADLAERILDEVSAADQDWRLVERWARELAELAALAARSATGPEHPLCDP
jgi:hypothetical protein